MFEEEEIDEVDSNYGNMVVEGEQLMIIRFFNYFTNHKP